MEELSYFEYQIIITTPRCGSKIPQRIREGMHGREEDNAKYKLRAQEGPQRFFSAKPS